MVKNKFAMFDVSSALEEASVCGWPCFISCAVMQGQRGWEVTRSMDLCSEEDEDIIVSVITLHNAAEI